MLASRILAFKVKDAHRVKNLVLQPIVIQPKEKLKDLFANSSFASKRDALPVHFLKEPPLPKSNDDAVSM